MSGTITPKGAKNEALQVMCAPLLTAEKVTISNIPDIADIRSQLELLRGLGVKIEHPSHDTYTFQADSVDLKSFEDEAFLTNARRIRGSVMLIGALLGRFRHAIVPKPGGDKIGRRRRDTHFRISYAAAADVIQRGIEVLRKLARR